METALTLCAFAVFIFLLGLTRGLRLRGWMATKGYDRYLISKDKP